jgi:hypothetical protein
MQCVIMLTAQGDPLSRVLGLEMGADDYLGPAHAAADPHAARRGLFVAPGEHCGPRVERRHVIVNGSPCWGTVDGDALRLDDGRTVALDGVQHLPPCTPSEIICVHLSYSSRGIETRNNAKPTVKGADGLLPLGPGIVSGVPERFKEGYRKASGKQ